MRNLQDIAAACEGKTFDFGSYQPPYTTKMAVETEGGFCGSVTLPEQTKSYKATGHEIGETYDFTDKDLKDAWE